MSLKDCSDRGENMSEHKSQSRQKKSGLHRRPMKNLSQVESTYMNNFTWQIHYSISAFHYSELCTGYGHNWNFLPCYELS